MLIIWMLRIALAAAGGLCCLEPIIEPTGFDTAEVKLVLTSKDLYWLLQNRS